MQRSGWNHGTFGWWVRGLTVSGSNEYHKAIWTAEGWVPRSSDRVMLDTLSKPTDVYRRKNHPRNLSSGIPAFKSSPTAIKGNHRDYRHSPAQTQTNYPAVAPFRCQAAIPQEGGTRAVILPGCPSLDRGCREAEVGFEPRTFRSVNSPLITWSISPPYDKKEDVTLTFTLCRSARLFSLSY
ncbi:hypothetical protein T265_07945 [Opisthorchis viverrini]|uniref:Uncharacterized protein n=1 Tax=Opisthorchis viverrini TaxID=6198 RepID=A0A074ZB89_OPIVI|nr:hypothetical protein T265_07945 [Opisthorchis viverrini]KER24388.1 hypothetical protein T265_07945 [Opisthorchis viverrini]